MTKTFLRQKFAVLQNLPAFDDDKILDKALDLIQKYRPKVVGVYIARKNEVDLLPMMMQCRDIICAAPKIQGEHIFFVNYYPGANLQPNAQYSTYFEPISENVIIPDLIFVPGLAFDTKGHRLGMGKGHYDKYLACHDVIKVGVCRAVCLTARLPSEKHDVKMDYVITEDFFLK